MAGVAIAIVGVAACAWDLRTQRIPNALTFGTAAAGIAFYLATAGWAGAGTSVAGWLAGTALFFPLFALRGMGAGDVKLLAAFGAWLGPLQVVYVAIAAALIGAVLALIIIVRPIPGIALAERSRLSLYYSLPITAGALVTIWLW